MLIIIICLLTITSLFGFKTIDPDEGNIDELNLENYRKKYKAEFVKFGANGKCYQVFPDVE